MFVGKRDHLRRLCLSYFVRVSPALGDSFIMNAEREMHCTFALHVEELFSLGQSRRFGHASITSGLPR